MNTLLKLQARLESEGYQVWMQLLAPGTVFDAYRACAPRIDAVYSGRLRLVIGDRECILGPGDWIEIPAGVIVTCEVVGDEPVLSLDAARESLAS